MIRTVRPFVRPVMAVFFVLAFIAGGARAGEVVTERRLVETEGAQSVSADIFMNTGNMVVGGVHRT